MKLKLQRHIPPNIHQPEAPGVMITFEQPNAIAQLLDGLARVVILEPGLEKFHRIDPPAPLLTTIYGKLTGATGARHCLSQHRLPVRTPAAARPVN
jgi:hypothetical protein